MFKLTETKVIVTIWSGHAVQLYDYDDTQSAFVWFHTKYKSSFTDEDDNMIIFMNQKGETKKNTRAHTNTNTQNACF